MNRSDVLGWNRAKGSGKWHIYSKKKISLCANWDNHQNKIFDPSGLDPVRFHPEIDCKQCYKRMERINAKTSRI